MDREELKRLTEEEMGRRIQEGVKAVIEQVLEGGDAKGHGGLGFPALPGHGPALGRGRETHKNRNLTTWRNRFTSRALPCICFSERKREKNERKLA